MICLCFGSSRPSPSGAVGLTAAAADAAPSQAEQAQPPSLEAKASAPHHSQYSQNDRPEAAAPVQPRPAADVVCSKGVCAPPGDGGSCCGAPPAPSAGFAVATPLPPVSVSEQKSVGQNRGAEIEDKDRASPIV